MAIDWLKNCLFASPLFAPSDNKWILTAGQSDDKKNLVWNAYLGASRSFYNGR